MSGETITVKTRDEHSFEGQLYSAADANAPLLIFLPELGRGAREYAALGKAMAGAGVSFFVFDLRGTESSSLRASPAVDFGLRVMLEEDLPWAQIAVRKRNKHAPIWLGGHGLGGQLATLFVARAPAGIEGLVLIASGNVRIQKAAGTGGSGMLGKLFGKASDPKLAAVVEPKTLQGERSGISRTGRYKVTGSVFDYDGALPKLRKQILALNFADDPVAPPQAAAELLDQLTGCKKSVWNWTFEFTGGVALDHHSWAQEPQLVAPDVCGWLHSTRARPAWP